MYNRFIDANSCIHVVLCQNLPLQGVANLARNLSVSRLVSNTPAPVQQYLDPSHALSCTLAVPLGRD